MIPAHLKQGLSKMVSKEASGKIRYFAACTAVSVAALCGVIRETPDSGLGLEHIHASQLAPHYAMATGVANGLTSRGEVLPDDLSWKMSRARERLEELGPLYEAFLPQSFILDMVLSEGEIEAYDGSWTARTLESYVDSLFENDPYVQEALQVTRDYLVEQGVSDQDALKLVMTSAKASTTIAARNFDQMPDFELDREMREKHPAHLAQLHNDLTPFLVQQLQGIRAAIEASLDQTQKINDPFDEDQTQPDPEVREKILDAIESENQGFNI